MRIHYLQHVPFEGPGFIDQWARKEGHGLTGTALFEGEPLPEMDRFDLLAILGGPMGVQDTSEHIWLNLEKQFIEKALGQNKRILGICLGAQLLADVLGARVFKNRHKEIGWYPVTRAAAAENSLLADLLPDHFHAFHWHGDTFDLPADALHLAQSEACQHQAFFYPPFTLGLQFHLESTAESIEKIMAHCAGELIEAPYVQNRTAIQKRSDLIAPSNDLMAAILDHLQKAK